MHVGIGGDHAVYGDRTPAIYFYPGGTRMHIPSAINGNSNHVMSTPAIPLNEWSRVEVSQFQLPDKSYQMTVMVGDTIVDQVTNTDPREFIDVKVFTSDNYYETAKARIDNLKILTFPDSYHH